MPISLLPTPRRIHRTHENFDLAQPVRLLQPPGIVLEIEAAIREALAELIPNLDGEAGKEEDSGTVSFSLLDAADPALEEVPPSRRREAVRIVVSPRKITVAAGSPAGCGMGARLLRGLRERDELVGLELLDWPGFSTRQLDLPWSAATLSEASLRQWLGLAAASRFSHLGLPGDADPNAVSAPISQLAERLGITIVPAGVEPTFRLMERPGLFPGYSVVLPALQETAIAAEGRGETDFAVSLGELDARTSLEALAYGAIFAGDCAWNPRKADLKAHRRWYSMRRFGFDSRGPTQAVDEMEAAARSAEPSPGAGVEGQAPGAGEALSAALEGEDPFTAPTFAAVLQPEDWATALERRAGSAMAALGPLQPDSEERALALQGLQWTAQRLRMLGRRFGTAEKVRQLYRGAHVALASPKAVSERLLRAADLLEQEAKTEEEHRLEWHALWRRERHEPFDEATEAALREPVARYGERAARLRSLRDRYIQTGTLPAPAEEGLERVTTRLAEGLLPTRLPSQPSPAWWPPGGEARIRIVVDCPAAAAGMPWEVQVDFRALAGETGAFSVRSARLMPLTEKDEAGPERPCQIARAGFVFFAEPGQQTYFLYLDPLPGEDSGFRETRASQSRAGLRLENRRMKIRLSPTDGSLNGWCLKEPELELLPDEPKRDAEVPGPTGEWRLRVLETGPLLARARAEHPDGRTRQFDLTAGQSWVEMSVNAPWSEFFLPLGPEIATKESIALIRHEETDTRRPLGEGAGTGAGARWAALQRPDGLTVAALLPEQTAGGAVGRAGLRLQGEPNGGRVLLFAAWEAEPVATLARLLAARQEPPRVRLGIVERRRVREF